MNTIRQNEVAMQSLHGITLLPGDKGDLMLQKLGAAFRRWCRHRKLDIPPAVWSLHLIGRGESDSKNTYPELDSNIKAVHCKIIFFFYWMLPKRFSKTIVTAPLMNLANHMVLCSYKVLGFAEFRCAKNMDPR